MENQDERSVEVRRQFIPANISDPSIEEDALHRMVLDQDELKREHVQVEGLKQQIEDDDKQLQDEVKNKVIKPEEAKSERKWAMLELALSILIMIMTTGVVFNSLAPTFYGMEWMALAVAVGAGILGACAAHLFLKYLKKILEKRHFDVFVTVMTFFMLILAIWGAIWLSMSRSLQMKMKREMVSPALFIQYVPLYGGRDTISQIDFYNNMGTVLFFTGAEWISGLLLFRALGKLKRCGTIVRVARRMESKVGLLNQIQVSMAEKVGKTLDDYRIQVLMARRNGQKKTSRKIMLILLAVFIGAMLLLLLFSGKAHSASVECGFTLIGRDITGSHELQSYESDKAVVHTIETRKQCDEGIVMHIHENTFSAPEYVTRFRMPPRDKIGYWGEELRNAKSRAIREYLEKSAKIPRKRCWTDLPNGIFLFGKILKEQPHRKKNLCLLSDMRPSMPDLSEKVILQKGDKILSQMKAEGLVADLKGIDVWVMGFSPAGLTVHTYKALESFWRGFFEASGCNLRCMDVGYGREIE